MDPKQVEALIQGLGPLHQIIERMSSPERRVFLAVLHDLAQKIEDLNAKDALNDRGKA